jgi:hypothetical protein
MNIGHCLNDTQRGKQECAKIQIPVQILQAQQKTRWYVLRFSHVFHRNWLATELLSDGIAWISNWQFGISYMQLKRNWTRIYFASIAIFCKHWRQYEVNFLMTSSFLCYVFGGKREINLDKSLLWIYLARCVIYMHHIFFLSCNCNKFTVNWTLSCDHYFKGICRSVCQIYSY